MRKYAPTIFNISYYTDGGRDECNMKLTWKFVPVGDEDSLILNNLNGFIVQQ